MTLADKSGDVSALWGTWTWIVVILIILAAWLFCCSLTRWINRLPTIEEVPGTFPGECDVRRCTRQATIQRFRAVPTGGIDTAYVCVGHNDEGDLRGWWCDDRA